MIDDPWSEFQPAPSTRTAPMVAPADPWGEFKPAPGKRRKPDYAAAGATLVPTGQAHDGDTFALTNGQNARLYGADAFELAQTGRARDGTAVQLGQMARTSLLPYLQPGAVVTPTGAATYGRPVASLERGGDAADGLLRQGLAVATPSFLKGDPNRLSAYMEAERFARLNGKGAWQTAFQQPASYRHKTPDPWAKPETGQAGDAVAVFNDEPMPFQGLRPEIAQGYAAIFQNMASKPEDLLAYAKANGFQIDEGETRKLYARRAKAGGAGNVVSYKDAPRVLTDNKDGATGSFLRGVADPINMLDEMGAVVDTVVPNARENVWSSDRRFGDILANNLDQNRSILAYDDANHPYARFGGQLAGGLITPGASVEGLGYRAAAEVLRNGGTRYAAEQAARQAVVRRLGVAGAIEGGLAGVGQGEDARGRFQGALIGAPAGLALGTAAGALAPAVGRLIGRPFSRLAGRDGEQAAQDLADGAIDSAKSRASNDLPRPRDVLDIQPAPFTAPDTAARQPDFLTMPPRYRTQPSTSAPSINTAAPIRSAPPARTLADVQAEAAEWAAQRGWRRQEGDGLPPIMLHGSPRPDIQEFDPYGRGGYGLFGAGTYLTDSADIASQYTGKGLSKAAQETAADRTLYAVRQAVKNPLDMDKAADRETWEAVAKRVVGDYGSRYFDDLPQGATNEQMFREVEDILSSEGVTASEGRETMDALVRSLGHDGITHIGGGRVNKDGPRHRVVIALDPEQTEIVDRLSIGKLMQPPGPRNPDWIDVGQVAPRNGGVAPLPSLDPLAARRGAPVDYLNVGRPAQAMANETPSPSLTGPVADEWAEFTPAAQTGASAERIAQAEGVTSRDMLPLPANTVDGVDEAARIEAGRYAPVRAPNEDAAPVRAYEEWGENAPNLAGNIRLDKLDSPQAIKRALAQTDRIAGGFDAARRGRITQAETKSLAEDLGMTADDLLKRRKGQAFNAEEALAARQLLARSASDLVNMAKRMARVQTPGDELEAAFRGAWLRHAAIQEQVAGMTAEAGRLLQQFRMTADSRDVSQVLSSLGETLGGTARMKDVAERIVDLEKVGTTPAGINQFALRSLLPKWRDKAIELYINSLLSGPQTHAVNILSNTLTSLAQIPEHAVAAGIGAVRKALPGQAETDRVLFSELGTRAAGMVSGAREGMAAAARSFLTGDAADAVTKVESQMSAIGGRAGRIIRTPTRLLTAEDELFKGIASRMELNGLAMRQAVNEGLKGQAARDRAADLVLNPTDELLQRSMDYARYLTFQTPLRHGSFSAGLSAATQGQPLAKLLLPFIRTPMNLLKFAAERSPAALAMKSWRKEYAAGGARRDMAITRAVVGTGVGAAIYEMALAGHITGGGPADRSARRLLEANGWQPYSLKIGDRYYSYARLDPFSTTIGTVADLVDLRSHMTDAQQERSGTLVLAAIANNLTSKTWLSGLSSALEAVNDPGRYMDNFVSRTAGAIAVPALVAQVARETDPLMREARGPMDRIRSRIPGVSTGLYPRRDVFGRPMEAQDAIGPDIISPVYTGQDRGDPTIAALVDAGATMSMPAKTYKDGGKYKKWTPEQYDSLQAAVGELAKPRLDALVSSPSWRAKDREGQQNAVGTVMKNARMEAKRRIMGGMMFSGFPAARSADPWAEFKPAR
ncbi:hypothetical protein SAQ01S_08970 [Sphingomonas aquatilis NBRC 16722]|uniref:Endonuclease YncB(Thermonuclease family) n=1 Tax=Sphingomonas aquatilis TaxID=93063 RepID=A0AAW3TRS2_9SPHN|nr:hypothetical protein [Sphingomonas aquatilis]MBB3874825.1 endonuclease YncB(thermonuclease family) [Sphingomonas aquatilis]GEM71131.1 hypothetical protein SAQ01S_08970 [Sphingomonas aquatilis NBRC 16722]